MEVERRFYKLTKSEAFRKTRKGPDGIKIYVQVIQFLKTLEL